MAGNQPRIPPLETFALTTHREGLSRFAHAGVPTVAVAIAGVICLLSVAAATLLWSAPWVQTALGIGSVIALDPADRVQSINALVDGRVKQWFVKDGSVVREGDPIVEIIDVDPLFVERIEAERNALQSRLNAARIATETAKLNYQRQEQLYNEGLSSRKEFEAAKIRYKDMLAKEQQARASVAKAEIGVSRQSSQTVFAPQDGRILDIIAGNKATLITAGDAIARFAPEHVERAIEVFVNGLDAPLIQPGLGARIMFEGWPAVQFSGWPESAIGTFAGVVQSVDPAAASTGRFRVLIVEDQNEVWPAERYLRLGSQARAWIQFGEVRLGYELWRRLNRFPPRPVDGPAGVETR